MRILYRIYEGSIEKLHRLDRKVVRTRVKTCFLSGVFIKLRRNFINLRRNFTNLRRDFKNSFKGKEE